jgi:transcriptional regulator with XRE-family HTH domain
MNLQELGFSIRQAREHKGLTQDALSRAANLSRTTLNQLENGVFPDIGVKKLLTILHQLGKDLAVVRVVKGRSGPNFLRMARVTANVSYREALTEDELVHALLTGKVAHSKRPHLRTLLQEAPKPMIEGLIQQVGGWNKATDRIRKNLGRIAQQLDVERSDAPWRQAA